MDFHLASVKTVHENDRYMITIVEHEKIKITLLKIQETGKIKTNEKKWQLYEIVKFCLLTGFC
ncbi:MAG: hypothetical protein LC102_01565 [Ignavibacteriales bacterium]|nr:MAG: hypothetical protein F9K26_04685 [Ignavibacteriaceae bacterium]MBW7873410.1 hypothetical protein [Ignavibacteria bacterium]MCZ2142101.1 hypothetical protein [Ignavibacteriales bacterium]OQY70114.1 MAG: hypothetical protein B6D45_11780 [Ignavibacteriales bacterium UTCHB3]MBZ0197010.1 hypothetical protein [Ignavibacteriaceae bacterium]